MLMVGENILFCSLFLFIHLNFNIQRSTVLFSLTIHAVATKNFTGLIVHDRYLDLDCGHLFTAKQTVRNFVRLNFITLYEKNVEAIAGTHTTSLLLKRSLCSSWDAHGRSVGSKLVSSLICSARTGQFLYRSSGTFPFLTSPSVCTRSISVPKGWNNSMAITPTLYISDCEHRGKIQRKQQNLVSTIKQFNELFHITSGYINILKHCFNMYNTVSRFNYL